MNTPTVMVAMLIVGTVASDIMAMGLVMIAIVIVKLMIVE